MLARSIETGAKQPAPSAATIDRRVTVQPEQRPEARYFTDGITEFLTTDLSRIAGSFVISCNTAFTYKGRRVGAKRLEPS